MRSRPRARSHPAYLRTRACRNRRAAPRRRSWHRRSTVRSALRALAPFREYRWSEAAPGSSRPRIMDKNARVSVHDMPILRRATLVISFSTCTLMVPPAPISSSTRSALAGSPDAAYNNMLVSKNYRAFASSRSNLKSAGRRPRKARRRFSSSSRLGLRDTPNSRSSATWISISSPSFSSSASTTKAGRRTARLLPHFATCAVFSWATHPCYTHG